LRTFLHFAATGFYAGYLPVAPGTWATLLIGVPLFFGLKSLGEIAFFVGFVGILALSVVSSDFVEKELGEKDPSFVVIDEVIGFLTAMILVPVSVTHVVFGCAFFRLFDILKPYPIRTIEQRFPGGWGITLDDVLAGLYANLCVRLVSLFL
jgi:phosphatidylglycerophosphatase A